MLKWCKCVKTLARKQPAFGVVWQGDNYDEIKEFLCAEDDEIVRDGLNLIIKYRKREIEVPVGWYLIMEDTVTESGEYDDIYIKCVPPEFVSKIYEII